MLAALLRRDSGRWVRLPDSDQIGGWQWSWTGTRMVDPQLGGGDGGEVGNWGRFVPYGGILDPETRTWSHLANPPEAFTGGWSVDARGGPLLATAGWVYDDRDQTWSKLPRPEGAPEQSGSAVWAGDQLVVVGGVSWSSRPKGVASPHVWLYTLG